MRRLEIALIVAAAALSIGLVALVASRRVTTLETALTAAQTERDAARAELVTCDAVADTQDASLVALRVQLEQARAETQQHAAAATTARRVAQDWQHVAGACGTVR